MRVLDVSCSEHALQSESKNPSYGHEEEVSFASARLSFSHLLRKGPYNRSSSHDHDSRSQNAFVFSSGKSSSQNNVMSKLSNQGGEINSRVHLSPLQ